MEDGGRRMEDGGRISLYYYIHALEMQGKGNKKGEKKVTIIFGFLDEFNFSNDHIVKWEHELAGINDIISHIIGDKHLNQVIEVITCGLLCQNINHLLSNKLHLTSLSIASLAHL